jgi:uroporphyrinogen-III synthase
MTAQAARAAGFDARSADGDVAGLAALAAREARPGAGEVVHVRGRHAAGDLVGRLATAGVTARALELYDQAPVELEAGARALLARRGVDVLAVFSRRSAALLARAAQAAGWDLGATTLVALSAAADAGFEPEPGRRVIALAPTRDGMIAALAAV